MRAHASVRRDKSGEARIWRSDNKFWWHALGYSLSSFREAIEEKTIKRTGRLAIER